MPDVFPTAVWIRAFGWAERLVLALPTNLRATRGHGKGIVVFLGGPVLSTSTVANLEDSRKNPTKPHPKPGAAVKPQVEQEIRPSLILDSLQQFKVCFSGGAFPV